MNLTIWHNTKCSTSRTILEFLESKKLKPTVREYLHQPPTIVELQSVLEKMNLKPIDLVRKKESLYIENYKDKNITPKRWLTILSKNPILIERPIVISDTKAWIARPKQEFIENFSLI